MEKTTITFPVRIVSEEEWLNAKKFGELSLNIIKGLALYRITNYDVYIFNSSIYFCRVVENEWEYMVLE